MPDAIPVDEAVVAQNLPEAKPTIFIGLGGTGITCLTRLRHRLAERNNGDPDSLKYYAFLGIDSDKGEFGSDKRKALESPLHLAHHGMLIGLQPDDLTRIQRNLSDSYSHYYPFLTDDIFNGHNDLMRGAQRRRNYGRLMFVHKREEFLGRIKKLINDVRSGVSGAARKFEVRAPESNIVKIVIVSSIAGGTGAGSLIDCAYMLQDLKALELMGQNANPTIGEIHGYVVMPDAFTTHLDVVQHGESIIAMEANAFGALREIEHYALTRRFKCSAWGADCANKVVESAPFDCLYMFSGTNPDGMQCGSTDEVFDLVADALEFYPSHSQLATKIGANRNNYSAKYGELSSANIPARNAKEGGATKLEDPARYHKLTWKSTQRYSCMGISRITMKVPELRRLGAIRLLSRIALAKIGENLTSGTGVEIPEIEKKCRGMLNSVRGSFSLKQGFNLQNEKCTVRFTENASDKLKVQSKIDEVRQADGAEVKWHECMKSLDHLQMIAKKGTTNFTEAVDLNSEHKETMREIFQKVDLSARSAAGTLRMELCDSSKLALSRQVLFLGKLSELCESDSRSIQEKIDADELPRLNRDIGKSILEKWSRLEEPIWIDVFNLRPTAIRILRRHYSTAINSQVDLIMNGIGWTLEVRWLNELCKELKKLQETTRNQIVAVEGFVRRLESARDEVSLSFRSSRNIVLTTHLAGRQGESELDREIRAAFGDDDAQLLERAEKEFCESKASLLQVIPESEGSALTELITKATLKIADKFPAHQNVFEWLGQQTRTDGSTLEQLLDLLDSKAKPAWPISSTVHCDPTIRPASSYLLGCVKQQDNSTYRKTLKHFDRPQDKPELAETEIVAEKPFLVGEIAIVNDVHGYVIQTHPTLVKLNQSYERRKSQGALRYSHLDPGIISLLPSIRPIDDAEVTQILDSRDAALKGIVFGHCQWSDDVYKCRRDDGAQIEVGNNFKAISDYFKSNPAGIEFRNTILERIERMFESFVEHARAGQSDAEQVLYKLNSIRATYQKLQDHVFPATGAKNGNEDYHQHYTMLNRLMYEVDERIKAVKPELRDNQVINGIQRRAKEELHQHVKLVGQKGDDQVNKPRGDEKLFAEQLGHRLLCWSEQPNTDADACTELLREVSRIWLGPKYRFTYSTTMFPELSEGTNAANS